jgi:16S rRNA processing protein RimM
MVLVGRVSRPHGIRGQVVVSPETDFAEARFRAGAVLWIQREAAVVPVTVTSARFGGARPVVAFEGCVSVDEAQRFVGLELRIPEEALQPLKPGTYYHHQLVGCMVETVAGTPVGTVTRVDGGSAGSTLAVTGGGGEVLVPLTATICVEIDIAARRIRVAPPEGLLELNETKRRRA